MKTINNKIEDGIKEGDKKTVVESVSRTGRELLNRPGTAEWRSSKNKRSLWTSFGILYDFSGHKPDLEGKIQICFRYGFSILYDFSGHKPDLSISIWSEKTFGLEQVIGPRLD